MITSSTQPLADLCASGKLISPFYNIFVEETLGLLTKTEWQELVCDQFAATDDDLDFIDRLAGGHPFFTQLAAEALWYAYQEKSFSYDKLYQDVIDRLEPHMGSMWRDLSPLDQSVLHDAALGCADVRSNQQVLNNLHELGLLRDNHPFSLAFSDRIRAKHWG